MRDTLGPVYLITDGSAPANGDTVASVEKALQGGVRSVQLREKGLDAKGLLKLAKALRALTHGYGARLIINDRADVALLSGADGVHLGQNSIAPVDARKILGDKMLIGVSTHSLKEAVRAREGGADFIAVGPVYHTPSKAPYGEPIGPDIIREVKAVVDIPVYAIGGIDKDNLKETVLNGADGVAVISAILKSEDIEKSAKEMIAAFRLARGGPSGF
ncbi:MAG: thiamine phosphate synthase [Deltaproteobacteria bacterium]|nr:thiamine phosphate synthase [Deltaproteobacteria bacterium]